MFDIGGPEFLFLVLLALLVFGPRRLPALGRAVGEQAARLRRAWIDLRRDLEREVAGDELDSVRRGIREAGDEVRRARDLFRPGAGSAPRGPRPGGDGTPP